MNRRTKRCEKCGLERNLEEFSRRAREKDLLNRWCKPCCAAEFSRWYQSNLDAAKKACRERAAERRANGKTQEYEAKDPDRWTRLRQEWRTHNIDRLKKNSAERSQKLVDAYVRGVIVQRLGVKCMKVPDLLIETKRVSMKLNRLIKRKKQ